jgi:hypothetical protein
MKRISTVFFLFTLIFLGLVGYSIKEDVPNDVAPPVSENYTGNVQSDTTPPGSFPYPTRFNWNYSLIPGVNGGTVGACLVNGNWILNRWNNTSYYRYASNGPGGGPGTLTDSGTYIGGIRDMTIQNGFLLGGQAAGTIYKMHPTTLVALDSFVTAGQYRAIAWDKNRKGFWGTNFTGNIQCFDSNGVLRGTINSSLTGKYGLAWDSVGGVPALWVWTQGTGVNEIIRYNISTGAIMNTYNFFPVNTEIAGGAEIMVQNGRNVLALNYQNFALAGYDLGPASNFNPGYLCFNRNGRNAVIPDNNPVGVKDSIFVGFNIYGGLKDILVIIDTIIHPRIGDLTAILSHNGQADTLFSRLGTGAIGNTTDNMINVKFTDSATIPISSLHDTINPSHGTFLPGGRSGVDSLRKHFIRGGPGSQPAGLWILTIKDHTTGDSGVLKAWSICMDGYLLQILSNTSEMPDRYRLQQNYPNPFNPVTKIKFAILRSGHGSLKVYDMLGREVKTLFDDIIGPGEYTAEFDGEGLPSGTYFYRLQINDFVEIKKMVLLK